MADRIARTVAGISCALSTLFTIAAAIPNVAFPFNSQVPGVARINQPYTFRISESTFAPKGASYVYSLSNQPAWLTIDSATRILVGTPGAADAGSKAFTLTAADNTGAAHMDCTLVVSIDPAPQLTGDVSKQLAEKANLSSSEPPIVTLLPSTPFNFDFKQESFIDIVQRELYYYASLADHTPLPSWLVFDSEQLTFSGTAPDLSSFPQSWNITLIASDVVGFAGASASFTLTIGTQQLVFVPEEQEVNITAGEKVNITVLQNELFRNNANLSPSDLKNAQADLPSWLRFDASTLAIDGTAPTDLTSTNITVSATDRLGNTATAIINLVPGNASLFDGQIGILTAQAGKSFTYHFDDSLFSEANLNLTVSLPTSATWLNYNADSRDLEGPVPSNSEATTVRATLTARPADGREGQAQTFSIDIKAAAASRTASSTSMTTTATLTPTAVLSTDINRGRGLSGGVIAAIVILSMLGAVLLSLLIWCLRRRRRDRSYVENSPSPFKQNISRPILSPGQGGIAVTTELQRDVEKEAGVDDNAPAVPPKESDPPPQITLNFPDNPNRPKSKWSKRFSRISLASSLGVGEDAIRADSNIPEWGQESAALHTPHDSFFVPTEMARVSRHLSQTSPTKRALKRLKDRHGRHRSESSLKKLSVGLGVDGGGLARHSSRRTAAKHRRGRGSFGVLSTTREASSMVSVSTRGTSVLSTRPSDFPRPPLSMYSSSMLAMSFLGAAMAEESKRKSIRLVGRSDSIKDDRPIDVKRQSFIRNRASTTLQSPLFAHGSRVSSNNTKQTGQRSANVSIAGSVRRSWRGKSSSMLTTYSESSSLEPQGHQDSPHRDSRQDQKRFSQKIRNAFQPNYPRAVTRSTLYDENGGLSRASRAQTDSSGWTGSSMDSEAWIAELSKPRQERNFVLPGEASPTPPPVPPTSRQESAKNSRNSTPSAHAGAGTTTEPGSAAERLKQRMLKQQQLRERSASPLSQSGNVQVISRSSPSVVRKTPASRPRNRLSEPVSLVSADSMHQGRSRIGNARRPVSVEEAQRLSSMRGETDAATTAGSERDPWLTEESGEEDLKGAGLILPHGGSAGKGTMRSDLSGPAFL